MSVYPIPDLKTRIDTYINTNGVKAITGPVLNSILKDVIDSLNEYTDDELTAAVADLVTNTALTTALTFYLAKSGGAMTGDININTQKIFSTSAILLKSISDSINLINQNDFAAMLNIAALTANRTITFQNKDITVAGLDDIKNATVVLTTTPLSHTGNTAETVKYTEEIPVGTFTTHDKIFKEILVSAIGGAGTKTIKCYVNTTADLTGSPVLISTYFTNHLQYSLLSSYFVDSITSMKSYKSAINNSATYWGSSNSSNGSFSINWNVKQYLVVTVQLAFSTDVIQLEAIFLNRHRK